MVKCELNNSVPVKIENLKKDIKQIYAQCNDNDAKKDKEMVLSAVSGKGKRTFKMQFKGDCRICGVKGHKAGDCWENPKNKDKRPPNYKSKLLELIGAWSLLKLIGAYWS